MGLSLIYLVNWFWYRITEFLRHWYFNAFLNVSRKTINILERLDRNFALRITLRNFFRPLYQDYTFIGYLIGFIFRFWRMVFASIIYGAIILVAALIYIVWAAFPLYIIYRGLS